MPHTPGPWTIPDWRQLGKIDVVADTVKVAAVYLQPDKNIKRGWPTEEANARLIAAAPELLEACRMVERAMTFPPNADGSVVRLTHAEYQQVLVAITKATKKGG